MFVIVRNFNLIHLCIIYLKDAADVGFVEGTTEAFQFYLISKQLQKTIRLDYFCLYL